MDMPGLKGVIKTGTVASQHHLWTAWVDGRPFITLHELYSFVEHDAIEPKPDWEPYYHYRVVIDGDPGTELILRGSQDARDHAKPGYIGYAWTAMEPVNAIPAICDGPPGFKSHADLGLMTVRGSCADNTWARPSTCRLNVATIIGMAQRGGADDDRRARGEQTRRDLIEAGRELFVEHGFFNTSIGDLVAKSGVGTRGAFYHHFKDKAELFRAVFEDVENDLTLRSIATPPPGTDPWERLTSGLHGFLEAATEPAVQRVILVDGPVVLGWQTLREIQEGNSIALINELVREAIAEGIIDDQPVGELTHMLVAALEEASRLVAHAANPARARRRAAKVLDRLLLSFAVAPRKVLRR